MALDVILDPVTGDLGRVTQMIDDTDPVEGRRITAQRIRRRLLTFLGTWILDQRAGLPYLDWMQSTPDPNAILLLVRREVEDTSRVVRTEDATVTFDRAQRRITVSMVARLESGTTVALTVLPFGVLGNPAPAVTAE